MDWLKDTIRREGQAMFSEHPSSEDIVLFVEAPGEIPGVRVGEIEQHLRVCAACGDDIARLEAVIRGEAHGVRSESARGRVRGWLRWSQWVPALVVAGIAAMVLATRDSHGPLVLPVGQPHVLLSDVERGAGETVVRDVHGRITLMFTLPATVAGAPDRCGVRIESSDGTLLAEAPAARALDAFGSFLISLDAHDLAPGEYILVAHDATGETRFAFVLGAED